MTAISSMLSSHGKIVKGVTLSLIKDSKDKIPQLNEEMSIEERCPLVRNILREVIKLEDKLGVAMGEFLYEAKENRYWKAWGYHTFESYVEFELEFGVRKAHYLISIYRKFIVELGVPDSILVSLEWSKAKEVLSIINEDNWVSMLSDIRGMSLKEVQSYVRKHRLEKYGSMPRLSPVESSITTVETKEPVVRLSFPLHPDQADNVRQALNQAGRLTGSERMGNQLDLICSDFLAGHVVTLDEEDKVGAKMEKLEFHIENLERAFGVKLAIVKE